MADTVKVTPLSRKIEFFDDAIEAEISLAGDGSGDLTISAPGQLNIGDTSTDIYIGDGLSNVDIVFEVDGEIRTSGAGVNLSLISAETLFIDTPLLAIDNGAAGKVGIGTTTPAGKLGVQLADATSNGAVSVWDDTYALFGNAASTTGECVGIGVGTGGGVLVSREPGTGYEAMTYMASAHHFKEANTVVMTIDGGNVTVDGGLFATTKEFLIDHPTKPGMKLHHGSLEGPEHAVYVRGQHNASVITLPDYWKGLVDEDTITVQLTPIGEHQELFVKEIKNGRVRVASKKRNQMLRYFYLIHGERKDVEKLVVEV